MGGVGRLVILGSLLPASSSFAVEAKIVVNGLAGLGTLSFGESRTSTEFVETSRFQATYQEKTGPGFEAGLRVDPIPHLGLFLTYSRLTRTGSADFSAMIPHPLYFNQPRSAQGALDGLTYTESAAHLDLVVSGKSGAFELFAFGGGSLFKVQCELIDQLQYTQTYPYDTVTLHTPTKIALEDSPKGFNVGASVDYRVARHLALGIQARYSRATAQLLSAGKTVSVDVGGTHLGGGLRLVF